MACFSDVPPRNDTNQPWEEVAVDLAGPWEIEVTQLGKVKIFTFTIIDTSTNLAEIKRIDNKTSAHISQLFVNEWLSRYPRPLRCIHDKGGEFVGFPFQDMLRRNGIRAVRITTKNPQANAIIERLHLTMGNMLCTQLKQAPTVATAIEYVDNILASITYATRVATHRTLQISPGSLVFQRDMLLPIPIIANYAMLRARRQAVIDEANRKENLRRQFKDYSIGDQVLIRVKDPSKLEDRFVGPYNVTIVHVNGTITIQRGQTVLERVNIRRLKPYTI